MMCPKWIPLLLSVLLTLACSSESRRPPQTTPEPDPAPPQSERIPFDPAVSVGTLPNGLTYYIRSNSKPENRAQLRLVLNAGSIVEDDDQRGLAHFIDRLAKIVNGRVFSGTGEQVGDLIVADYVRKGN